MSDWPARASAQPAAGVRKKRGPWFGASIALGVVLGVPLLLYAGLVIYVRLGYLDQAIREAVVNALGPGASIERVNVGGLETLRAEGLRVPSRNGQGEPALAAEAILVHWNPWNLALDQRIGSLTIQRPTINLRRDPQGEWNFAWPQGGGGKYRLEQAVIRDGSLNLEWAPTRRVRLQHLEVTLARPDPPLPSPFTLSAELPSRSHVQMNLLTGPGPELSARASGTLDLLQDLREALPAETGLQGHLAFDLSGRREARPGKEPASSATSSDLLVDGALTPRGLRWDLGRGRALCLPDRSLQVHAAIAAPALAPLPLQEVRLRMDGLGWLSGRVEAQAEAAGAGSTHLRIRDAGGNFDLDSLRALFEPNLLPVELLTRGELEVSKADLSIPLLSGRWPKGACEVKARGVRVAWPGLGELPPLDFHCGIESAAGALKVLAATLTAGAMGRASIGAEVDLTQPQVNWMEVLRGLRLETLKLDLGRLADSEWGRRLQGGAAGAGPAGELPIRWRGILSGANLGLGLRAERGERVLSLEGLALEDLQLLRWPLPLATPEGILNGTLRLEVHLAEDRLLRAVVCGDLRTTAQPPLKARWELHAEADASGTLKPRRLRFPALVLPLAEFARLAGLQNRYGLAGWKGMLTLADGEYDLVSGECSCALQLDGLGVQLDKIVTVASVSGITGRARLTYRNSEWTLAGRLEAVKYVTPVQSGTLPPLDFSVSTSQKAPAAPREMALYLNYEGGGKLAWKASVQKDLKGVHQMQGQVESTLARGLALQYELPIDLEARTAGPLFASARDVDLASLRAVLQERILLRSFQFSDHWLAGGVASRLELNLGQIGKQRDGPPGPVRWDDLLKPQLEWKGELSGTLQDARFGHLSTRTEAEHLNGTFRLKFSVDESAARTFDLLATLTSYEALVGGSFYLPPLADRKASLACSLHLRPQGEGRLDLQISSLSCEVEGVAKLSGSGRLQTAPESRPFSLEGGLLKVEVYVPDLAVALRELGVPNLRDRYPAVAAMHLSGSCLYKVQHHWDPDRAALSGTLNLQKVNLTLGGARKLVVRDLDGPLPLSFYRGLWPADWPREREGTLTVSGIEFPPVRLRQQPLAVRATPNGVELANAVVLEVPGGQASVTRLRMEDLLAPEPAVRFGVDVKGISLDELAKAEGWALAGLGETILKGRLPECALFHRAGQLGTWALAADGELTAPCYQGQLRIGGFHARGLFGSSPVWGGALKAEKISMLQFTGQNREFGGMKCLADFTLADFTSTGTRLEDVQTFRLEMNSADRPNVEDYYDGRLALLLAPEQVRAAARQYGVSEEKIVGMRFTIRDVGLAFDLRAGRVRGPMPTQGDGMIVRGKGKLSLTGNQQPSPDVPGSPNTYTLWTDCIAKLRAHKALVSKLPQE